MKVPIYNLATREDHIAPAKSVLLGSKNFGGPVKFVLAGSGHIAGVVNPPSKTKYQYWTGDKPHGADLDAWIKSAKENPGSWWPDWLAWLKGDKPTRCRRASRWRQIQANRGRAGELREGAGLDRAGPPALVSALAADIAAVLPVHEASFTGTLR